MDSSSNPGMNAAHLQRDNTASPYAGLVEGLGYGTSDSLHSNHEEFGDFSGFDPALFQDSTLSQGFSQQTPTFHQSYGQNIQRHTNSPGISQYNTQQPNYANNQYSQSMYNPQNLSHHGMDPRYFSRPSPSPLSYDQFLFQPQMNYANQTINPQHMVEPQRQSSTPASSYPPTQQPPPQQQPQQQQQRQPTPQQQQPPHSTQYMNYGQRPTQISHLQGSDMIQYSNFADPAQSQHYVDPSMLNANQMSNHGTFQQQQQQQQQYQPNSYFAKLSSNPDPQSLQHPQHLPIANARPLQPAPVGQQLPPFQLGIANQQIQEKQVKQKTKKDPNAPKKPRVKASTDGVVRADGQSSGSDSDSDDLSIEDPEDKIPPEPTPNLLIVSAPTDEKGKALYNAVLAVWTPRNKRAPAEKIRSGIAAFGETIRSLRDSWKSKNDNLKKSELPNSPTAAEVPRLKSEVAHFRQVMESIMTRSIQYGHPELVKRLGENQFTLSALYSFLLDRFTAGDFDSSLVTSILRLAVKFETIDEEMLELTKWSKILQRFAKKATNESKDFAQSILTNAAAFSKKKREEAKSASSPKPSDHVAGIKRSREGEAVTLPASKKTLVKPAVQSSKPLALQNAERRKAQEAAQAAQAAKQDKASASSTVNAGSATAPGGKTKVAVIAPPKSAVFSSLLSASKRPGTSLAARAAAAKDKSAAPVGIAKTADNMAKKEPIKRESPPRTTGPAAPAKTTSSFLGFLADMDKKEVVQPKKEEDIPEESEEQRKKRLRKEARSKLRVSWKSDAELVETRLFTHDPEEEIGHADSMMRDAGDTVKEGEMLKLHKGFDDLDDDEDEESFEEFEDYSPPSEVDLTDMEDLSINSKRFGGPVDPISKSRDAQSKFEENTIMVLYTSKADRPSSPKEPNEKNEEEEDDGDFQPCADFGEPDGRVRAREKEYVAKQRPQFQIPPQPQQQENLISKDLQRALSMLGQSAPVQPTPPPVATPGFDLQQLMATVQQVKQQLSQQQQQQQQQYQPPLPPPPMNIPNANLSALLAQMQQANSGLPTGSAGNPNPYPHMEDYSRKHQRSDSKEDYETELSRRSANKKKKGNDKMDGGKPHNYKTQVCAFWKEGKCLKGENCTYRHDE